MTSIHERLPFTSDGLRAMHQRGVAPDDRAAIREINVEVAGKMGVLPRTIANRANGHARPR